MSLANSFSVYIGSTPSPPRRIRYVANRLPRCDFFLTHLRQHNGELAQGARKTRSKRPWVMHMIVHGFPSRLVNLLLDFTATIRSLSSPDLIKAALQFEWAWQNPHKSRHLRDANGSIFGTRASKLLKKNIVFVLLIFLAPLLPVLRFAH
jgi:structure-specific endonuclease subunit SLX1